MNVHYVLMNKSQRRWTYFIILQYKLLLCAFGYNRSNIPFHNYLQGFGIDCHYALIDMQVVVVYKSPGTSCETLAKMLESERLPHVNKSKPIVVGGDFNIDVKQKVRG